MIFEIENRKSNHNLMMTFWSIDKNPLCLVVFVEELEERG